MIPETPHTRKEMYLARIAGQEVELPQMPHTREEMYLDAIANNGGGGGGSSVQSDWNVNDPASPAYVKNRPFYTSDPVTTTVFEGTDIPFSEEGGKYGAGGLSLPLEAGKIYDVTWDGVLYSGLTATIFNNTIVFIGNISFINASDQDTGEPFVIGSPVGNVQNSGIVTSESGATHSVSIVEIATQVVKIPSVYLDAFVINFTINKSSGEIVADKDIEAVYDALEAGAVVIGNVQGLTASFYDQEKEAFVFAYGNGTVIIAYNGDTSSWNSTTGGPINEIKRYHITFANQGNTGDTFTIDDGTSVNRITNMVKAGIPVELIDGNGQIYRPIGVDGNVFQTCHDTSGTNTRCYLRVLHLNGQTVWRYLYWSATKE